MRNDAGIQDISSGFLFVHVGAAGGNGSSGSEGTEDGGGDATAAHTFVLEPLDGDIWDERQRDVLRELGGRIFMEGAEKSLK